MIVVFSIMSPFNVVFFGKSGVGKTKLVEQIKQPGSANFAYYDSTYTFQSFRLFGEIPALDNRIALNIEDLSQNLSSFGFVNDSTIVGFYCVDLTAPEDIPTMKSDIELFKNRTQGAPLILVGTKADEIADRRSALTQLADLSAKMGFSKYYMTSAKTQRGVADIKDAMFASVNEYVSLLDMSSFIEKLKGNGPFYDAFNKFHETCKGLYKTKSNAIALETMQLIKQLPNQYADKKEAIEKFKTNCLVHIKGLHSEGNNIILALYATIVVAALAATIVTAAGFAPILVIASSCVLGLFAGVLSHYRLSQDAPAVATLEQVYEQAKKWEDKDSVQQQCSSGIQTFLQGFIVLKEYNLQKKNKDKSTSKSLKLAMDFVSELDQGFTINEVLSKKDRIPQKGSFFAAIKEVTPISNQMLSMDEDYMPIRNRTT